MQDPFHAASSSNRNRPLPRIIDPQRFRVSRATALREAHASLEAAERNLQQLTSGVATSRSPTRRPRLRREGNQDADAA